MDSTVPAPRQQAASKDNTIYPGRRHNPAALLPNFLAVRTENVFPTGMLKSEHVKFATVNIDRAVDIQHSDVFFPRICPRNCRLEHPYIVIKEFDDINLRAVGATVCVTDNSAKIQNASQTAFATGTWARAS